MANDHFVRFENVDKSYDGKQLVVKGLNLDIQEGEFVTMLGPSGSGKTTCLMMLAGFETPTNGQIYLDNKVISDIPPHKRGIGMVFQNYALFPHMTVLEPNVCFHMIAVMQFGDWGVEASEAIRVTENGSELFCNMSKELHIK